MPFQHFSLFQPSEKPKTGLLSVMKLLSRKNENHFHLEAHHTGKQMSICDKILIEKHEEPSLIKSSITINHSEMYPI